MGESLPVHRPPLNMTTLFGEAPVGQQAQQGGQRAVSVRYLTPHNKWSIHCEYQDNLFMLSPVSYTHLDVYKRQVLDTREGEVLVRFPRFDAPDGTVAFETRGVPIRRIGDRVVTTVLDLLLAHYGVARDGLPGAWPTGYDDASAPATPAWASEITGVPAEQITRLAREWAQNAICLLYTSRCV